jgi:hypothetical protein
MLPRHKRRIVISIVESLPQNIIRIVAFLHCGIAWFVEPCVTSAGQYIALFENASSLYKSRSQLSRSRKPCATRMSSYIASLCVFYLMLKTCSRHHVILSSHVLVIRVFVADQTTGYTEMSVTAPLCISRSENPQEVWFSVSVFPGWTITRW